MTDTLLCWHAERAGTDVLRGAISSLRKRKVEIGRVVYLVNAEREAEIEPKLREFAVEIKIVPLSFEDPTRHADIYQQVRDRALPLLADVRGSLHINVSPGTPAMHAVWLILHAGGAFPEGTRLWSSQFSRSTGRHRIDSVNFELPTYLGEIRRIQRAPPRQAGYEVEARSPARREALELLKRYARVMGAPLLILGERGIGKTRLVETFVQPLKQRRSITTVACGGLDSTLAESLLFGHEKGAFTGAAAKRKGLLAEADGGILFLDEVQDLPAVAQRQLVRVFQDRQRRFRPLGSDKESSVDVELVCASNLSLDRLRERLDADFFDRINHLLVTIPPLRECRDDLAEDWRRVWEEAGSDETTPRDPPWSVEMERVLGQHTLPGNLRDLQRLAVLLIAWMDGSPSTQAMGSALREWTNLCAVTESNDQTLGQGTREERTHWFQSKLALWAKQQYGTWEKAAKVLGVSSRTLRDDAKRSKP